MHEMAARVALVALAIGNGATGLLARLSPKTFYDDFPFGRGWVVADGPYNEHLVTDFGAALLASRRAVPRRRVEADPRGGDRRGGREHRARRRSTSSTTQALPT